MTPKPRRGFPRPHLQTILLALAVLLAIGLHVGLAGTVVADRGGLALPSTSSWHSSY